MATLLLMRHGKAAWPDVPDHERPLAERGWREAGLTGDWIRAEFGGVDAVLCSTATRTRETLRATGLTAPTTFHDEIYENVPGLLLETITTHAPGEAATVLMIGHSPGIPGLANALAGPDTDPATRDLLRGYPTSTVAVLEVPVAWAELERDRATLVDVVTKRRDL